MIKTAPHGTVSPQMYKKYKRLVTRPQTCWQDFVKKTCRTQKIPPDLFSRPILGDPGADSGDEEKSKRAEKYMARRKVKKGEKSPCFLAPIRSQNGSDRLELVW